MSTTIYWEKINDQEIYPIIGIPQKFTIYNVMVFVQQLRHKINIDDSSNYNINAYCDDLITNDIDSECKFIIIKNENENIKYKKLMIMEPIQVGRLYHLGKIIKENPRPTDLSHILNDEYRNSFVEHYNKVMIQHLKTKILFEQEYNDAYQLYGKYLTTYDFEDSLMADCQHNALCF